MAPTEEAETVQGGFIAERTIQKLKCKTPTLNSLTLAKLRRSMVDIVDALINYGDLNEEELEFWIRIRDDARYNADTDSEGEEDAFLYEDSSVDSKATESDLDLDASVVFEAVAV